MKLKIYLISISKILFFCLISLVIQAQTLDASFSSPSTIVCGDGTFTLNATNSSYQSYSWTISGPNAFTSNLSGSSASLNLTQTGFYDVSLTVSDGVSTETNTINGFLTVDAPPIVNAGVDQTICANSPVQLNGSIGGSATSAYWISWSSGTFSPTNINLSAVYSPSVQDIAIGYAQLILSTNDPVGPCSAAMDTIQIYIDAPVATVDAGVDQTVCANSAIQLNGTFGGQATSISWSGGSGTFTPNNASLAPTYSPSPIEITNGFVNLIITTNDPAGPCSAVSDTVLVTINQLPTFTLSSNSVCVNSSLQISSNNPQNTFNISNLSVATFGSNGITGIAEGTFFITVMSPSGCTTTSEQITVTTSATVDPIPDQIVCAGDSLTPISFSGSAQQYNWTNDNTLIGLATSGTGNISGFVANNPTAINQVATITVTPISGSCNATPTTFTITVKPLPTVNPSADQILCNNDFNSPINFSGTNTDFTVFNWTNDNIGIGLIASGTGNIPSFQVQNVNSIYLISNFVVTPSLNGCIGISDTFSIIVKPTPIISPVPDQTVCAGESTSAIVFSGSSQITTYFWNQSAATIGLTSSNGTGNIPAFIAQNLFDIPLSSSFNVTPILEGCIGVPINFTITVLPIPIVNAGNDTILCAGQSYTPIANGTATSYSWINYSNGVAFIPPSSIMLTLNGELNGCIASDNVLLTVVSNPIASITTFDGEDSLACDGTLSVLVTGGTAPYSYTWTNGASNYTTSAIQDLCSGTYSIAVVDANGCSATNSATINDTLIENVLGDTLIFTDNIYLDSTIIGSDTSAWIENCTFDYTLVTGATIDSYVDNGDSTIVTWIIALSNGSTVSVDATYYMSPGTSGVYNLTLQLFCSAKSGPKFLIASSRLYYEPSTIGVQSLSLNDVFLYPNPTWDKIFLQSSTNLIGQGYVITDFSGKTVQTGKINSEKQGINLENLKSGVYYIDMQNSSNKLKINKQ